MARDFQINGETMVSVRGNSGSAISSLQNLGLADSPIRVSLSMAYDDIDVDTWWNAPADVQVMLGEATVSMTLVHFDQAVLDACIIESMGQNSGLGVGGANNGLFPRAGTRLGNGLARFAYNGPLPTQSNHYISLQLSSPIQGMPWTFYTSYLFSSPVVIPLGAKRKLVSLTWRVIPYTTDPWGGGTGSLNTGLWANILEG